jgi:hypothetical protein
MTDETQPVENEPEEPTNAGAAEGPEIDSQENEGDVVDVPADGPPDADDLEGDVADEEPA